MQKDEEKGNAATPPADGPCGSLRERKHEFVLGEIERAAWDLFATVGFEGATVEEISRRAGVSRRTFFRYFRTKEEVLSYSMEQYGERIVGRFRCLPETRRPALALEEAFLAVSKEDPEHERKPKEMLGLMFQDPDLRGRFLHGIDMWVPPLAAELVRRKAYRGDPARCALMAAVYCTAFDQAHLRWYREDASELVVQIKRAFRQLRDLGSDSPR